MPDPIQLSLDLSPHRNQYLFSDHYLSALLPQAPRWREALPEAEHFQAWLRELYAQERAHLAYYNESQLEEHWFKPILKELGHIWEAQASIPGLEEHVKRPDYVFFVNDEDRRAAAGAQNTMEYASHALAVGEVKAWDVPLGKNQPGGGPSFEARNPSWQIDYYTRATGLTWGILSNGRLWRLVHKDSSQRLAIYYEVDLVDLLQRDEASAMRYFTLFFRQAAFRPDAQGRLFLVDVLEGSQEYAVELEEDLRDNVYHALGKLIQGFLDLPGNRLGGDDLRTVYDNSLYLLYRLLFILYGESRGLLPLHNEQYRENYSLTRLKEQIARLAVKPAPRTTLYWSQLQNLFRIINGDDEQLNRELGVPRYNGGLFNPQLHPFLEEKAVGDHALVEAIEWLSRRKDEFVDYRTLGVRQLGSIYEGLLEYQPRYAAEPMVTIRDGNGERWVTRKDANNAKVIESRDAGQVYLETDRGERKATGSYYTPEYIVKYIVENTLRPLLQVARQRAPSDGVAAARSYAEAVLNLKVLDPAMGSGHFLVDATEFLALDLATHPYLESEIAGQEDLLYWKRRVVERCIYGVDKNPLAVELAKLSLWLATVASDQPLSFLDHHLKLGDSLIGARVSDLGSAPPVLLTKKQRSQLKAGANLFEYRLSQQLPIVMGRIREITEVASDSYERVRMKEVADEAVRQLKAPFEAVANLWVSAYFRNQFTQAEYGDAQEFISTPDRLLAMPAVQRAQQIANERDFFHWELAFPEVFYDRDGQPLRERAGFDAVIGNPPYENAWLMTTDDPTARSAIENLVNRSGVLEGHWDLYAAFIIRVLEIVRENGWHSFIVPDALLREKYAVTLRQHLLTRYSIRKLMHFEGINVFDEVSRHSIVYALKAQHPTPLSETTIESPMPRDIARTTIVGTFTQEQWLQTGGAQIRVELANPINSAISDRVFSNSIRVGQFCYVMVGATTHSKDGTSFKKAGVVTPKPIGNAHKFFDGKTLQRYVIEWDGRYIDYRQTEMYGPRFPELFENPKVLVRKRTAENEQLVAAYDDDALYCDDTVIVVTYYGYLEGTGAELEYEGYEHIAAPNPSLFYLLALLNSKLLTYVFHLRFATGTLQGSYSDVYPQQVRAFPIRRIAFATPPDARARYLKAAQAAYSRGIQNGNRDEILTLVAQHLAHEPEESDVIHDLLAFLAEQMIELNKQKQNRIKTFWLDIEGVADAANFRALHGKGKQESSLGKMDAAFRPFIRADSHATRSLDESLAWSEDAFKAFVMALVSKIRNLSDLVQVYEQHCLAYSDLITRLEFTDRLIDQIVYKLYGLNEQGIEIVEGRATQ